jgi:uncharacterized membrane protein
VGVRTFTQVAKKGDAFFVYAITTPNLGMEQHEIPIQYQYYKKKLKRKM